VQVTFDGFNNQIIKDFARESKLFMPSKYNEIGDRFVVPYITPDGRQI
jgi:hypothetical protein